MDHAEWVEINIAAGKRQKPTAVSRRSLANGEGWHAAPDTLTTDQARIFDILGIVAGGIYNAPISWDRVCWRYGTGIAVLWNRGMATFDFHQLTLLVFLCHEGRIRCDIEPVARGYLRLSFHARGATGGTARRHPNLDEAVADFRRYLPADHRITFVPSQEEGGAPPLSRIEGDALSLASPREGACHG